LKLILSSFLKHASFFSEILFGKHRGGHFFCIGEIIRVKVFHIMQTDALLEFIRNY